MNAGYSHLNELVYFLQSCHLDIHHNSYNSRNEKSFLQQNEFKRHKKKTKFTCFMMMFKLITTSIKQFTLECAFYTPFLLWKCVPFQSDLNHDSTLSMVVKFQLCAPLFSKSTECNYKIFMCFYAYTKVKTIQRGFF